MEVAHADAVLRDCSRRLRAPQRKALEALHQLLDRAGVPLAGEGEHFASAVSETSGIQLERPKSLELDVAMATGSGKTHLALTAMRYLARTGQSRTFVILSHRSFLFERWCREFSPEVRESIGGSHHVEVVTRGGAITGATDLSGGVLVLIQTIQTVSNMDGDWANTVVGPNLREVIRARKDLVVIVDESHHLGDPKADTAWGRVIDALEPRMVLGLTATPRRGARPVLFEYPLRAMLRDGLFSKRLKVVFKPVPKHAGPEEIEAVALSEALSSRQTICLHLETLADDHPLRLASWTPKILVACRSIAHVNEVVNVLVTRHEIDRSRILKVTSKDSDEELLQRLNAIDQDPSIEIVVAAFMLDEGWDVTSITVIVPLRQLDSPANAEQVLGRGLRLPQGRVTGDAPTETLRLISLGQKTLEKIDKEVRDKYSSAAVVSSGTGDDPAPDVVIEGPTGGFERLLTRRLEPGLELAVLVPLSIDLLEDFVLTSPAPASGDSVFEIDVVSGEKTVRPAAKAAPLAQISSESDIVRLIPELSAKQARLLAMKLDERAGKGWRYVGAEVEVFRREVLASLSVRWLDTGRMAEFAPRTALTTSGESPMALRAIAKGWSPSHLWYTGFTKSVFDLSRFDGRPEFELAAILDDARFVHWWLRNDPHLIGIETAAGRHYPDFVVRTDDGVNLIELKGAHLRREFDADRGRLESVKNWCQLQSQKQLVPFSYSVHDAAVLDKVLSAIAPGQV